MIRRDSPFVSSLRIINRKEPPMFEKSVEELKKTVSESDLEYCKADAIRDKAVKFLTDNAVAEA